MDAKKTRAAIYTRVSTEDQAKEGFSLDAQLDKLKAYCKARDWIITREYTDDGYSGRNTNRPAYKKLLKEIDDWDVLLVIKMDRIHRNSKNFMLMMEKLKQNDKEFVSMTESLDTSTAMGRFVMDIIQRIAQLESEQIGERVYDGMDQKARTNGGPLGFNIPYGYNYEDGILRIDEVEGVNVKKIFEMYKNGSSMVSIARKFNEEKIPTKRGKSWRTETISKILKNPVYCGYFHWEDHIHPGNHQALIEIEDFNEIQNKIKERSTKDNPNLFFIEE
ncbi:MAG: recombinase family protein [Candidatus Thermoplasmatota archaeon]